MKQQGRPKKYGLRSPVILNLDVNLIGKIDRIALARKITRTELLTMFIMKGVEQA